MNSLIKSPPNSLPNSLPNSPPQIEHLMEQLMMPLAFKPYAHASLAYLASFAAFVMLTFAAPLARAEFVLFPGLGYTTQTVKSNGTKTVDTKLVSADGRLGYMAMGSGLYIGGMYKYESGTGDSTTVKAVSTGASLGFVKSGFSLIGTYFLQGTRDVTTAGVEKQYKKATGFQVDVAFMAAFSEAFFVGPQISYRSMKYAESSTLGVTNTSENYQLDTIQPTLAFLLKF